MEKEAQKYNGRAYAFFNCNASKAQIEAELPKIRQVTQTPSNLELTLDNIEATQDDNELIALAKEAKEAGLKYALKAKYPKSTNKQTADELAGILNQTYQSPLYQPNEPFKGAIIYQEKGKYIFRD
ncbi:MAG: hypothetical protein Q8L27_04055 [archaeon]|nr:hypothetical protein [archaeon]